MRNSFKMFDKRDWRLTGLIVILVIFALNSVIYKCLDATIFENLWTQKLSVWNDLALSSIAAMLWWYGLRSRYEAGLPSIATIEFIYNGKPIMRCIDSNLPDVASAREFSQSLGRELMKLKYSPESNDKNDKNDKRESDDKSESDDKKESAGKKESPESFHLDMLMPTISIKKLGIKNDHVFPNGEKSNCMNHKITITLTKLHKEIEGDSDIKKGKCLVWKAPFLQVEME